MSIGKTLVQLGPNTIVDIDEINGSKTKIMTGSLV